MDSHIGEKEIRTQKRLIGLFEKRLGYTVLGDWKDRENSNIEEKQLKKYLKKKRYSDSEITKAIAILKRGANDLSDGLYQANLRIYNLLRYGINILPEVGEQKKFVHLIDWNNPHENDFYIAEEVTIKGKEKATKRPDLVIYVNGIALGVIELKRCTSSVHNGIRQNLDNQKDAFIPHFFTTMQFLFAGNDTEGLYYGVIDTPEKFWLRWKESNSKEKNELDRSTLQVFDKERILELIHDFIIFDGGTEKSMSSKSIFWNKSSTTSC